MATTSNTYTGNGSNKLFSITFPYLDESDIDVYLNGTLRTITTHYFFANATTIEFVTAPSNGAVVLLDRTTDDSALQATFFNGSTIRSSDLNDNFDQVLFIAQETTNDATAATAASAAATATANAAASTAGTAATNASNALSTANTAATNASNAVSTANSANTTANNAATTANNAVTTANQAVTAVASVVPYTKVAAVANIPASPTNNQAIEVTNSTGIESFSPLSNIPAGYVGSTGLSVKIIYSTSAGSWNFVEYFANDPETRYLKLAGGTLTGQLFGDNSTSAATPGFAFDGDPNTGVLRPGADELALVTAGASRLTIDSSGNVAVPGGLARAGNNVVTVGDTGTVTSTMLLDGTILDADINASAAIAGSKIVAATTSVVGAVQLEDSTSSTSTTKAATPNSVKLVLDAATVALGIANDALPKAGGTMTGALVVPLASAATPSLTFTGDLNTGIFSPGADTLALATAGANRLHITSAGNVGIGTSAPTALLEVFATVNPELRLNSSADGYLQIGQFANGAAIGTSSANATTGVLRFVTAGSERARFDTSGNLGIGTTSPGARVHSDWNGGNQFRASNGSGTFDILNDSTNSLLTASGAMFYRTGTSGPHIFQRDGGSSEVARIDGSGRLLVGTSTAQGTASLQIQGDSASASNWGKIFLQRGQSIATIGSNVGTRLGQFDFGNQDGAIGASILVDTDAAWSAGDCPGRLVFSTTADGAASPTEQMRLDSSGNLKFNSGYGSVATAYGCRAWVNFNGTGTVAIRANGNVSSITDNGQGDYTINFTTAMPDSSYALVATSVQNSTGNSQVTSLGYHSHLGVDATTYSTTAVRINTKKNTFSQGHDVSTISVAVFR